MCFIYSLCNNILYSQNVLEEFDTLLFGPLVVSLVNRDCILSLIRFNKIVDDTPFVDFHLFSLSSDNRMDCIE